MAYINWNTQILPSVSLFKWYRLVDVVEYLHNLRDTVILDTRETEAALDLQVIDRSIHCNLPASLAQRFPENEIYLCEGIGSWHVKLDILALLAAKLHHCDFDNSAITRYDNDEGLFASTVTMEIGILQVINQLLQLIEERADLITRSRFELRYSLVWNDIVAHDVMTCDNIFCYTFKRIMCTALVIRQLLDLKRSNWLNVKKSD